MLHQYTAECKCFSASRVMKCRTKTPMQLARSGHANAWSNYDNLTGVNRYQHSAYCSSWYQHSHTAGATSTTYLPHSAKYDEQHTDQVLMNQTMKEVVTVL